MKAQWHEVDDFHEDLKLKTRLTKWVSRGERKTMGTIVIQKWYSVVYDNEGKNHRERVKLISTFSEMAIKTFSG